MEGWKIAPIPKKFPRWEGGFAPDPTTLVQTCGCFTARHRFGMPRSGEPHGRQCRLGWDAPSGLVMIDTGCMEMLWFIVDMFLFPEIQVGLPEVDGFPDIWSIFIIIKIKLVSVDIAIPLVEGDGRFYFWYMKCQPIEWLGLKCFNAMRTGLQSVSIFSLFHANFKRTWTHPPPNWWYFSWGETP